MYHPWFQPFYRALTVAACIAWFGFELWQQEILWLLLAGAATVYGVWDLFLSGNYRTGITPAEGETQSDPDDE